MQAGGERAIDLGRKLGPAGKLMIHAYAHAGKHGMAHHSHSHVANTFVVPRHVPHSVVAARLSPLIY